MTHEVAPSGQIRVMMTAGFRAVTTMAFFIPFACAIVGQFLTLWIWIAITGAHICDPAWGSGSAALRR
ncbi:hypothetical protein [Yoonia sp. SS1-5]|uniref:Uncharacterized protein n=1 Tax=Yoonia rhodophyticola TaxID=3137370 RepID=A0AAN0M789_9RHOB